MGKNGAWMDLAWPSKVKMGSWDDLAYAINFIPVEYSNKQSIRENAAEAMDQFANIWLPMPRDISTGNRINYAAGQTETTGGLFDPTTGGFFSSIKSGFGLFSAFNDLTGISAYMGKRPMDERDSIFKNAEFRGECVLTNE